VRTQRQRVVVAGQGWTDTAVEGRRREVQAGAGVETRAQLIAARPPRPAHLQSRRYHRYLYSTRGPGNRNVFSIAAYLCYRCSPETARLATTDKDGLRRK